VSGVASYLRSLNIDEPFVRQSSSNEFYHTDALGSVLALTNHTGVVQTTYDYEAFGKTTITGISANPFQYTGRENDGTGLYYYRARYYSQVLHRFLLEDLIGLRGGLNLYAYVNGSPMIKRDPFGLQPGDKFQYEHEVTIDFEKFINPRSIAENREYASWIYRDENGQYTYTNPRPGTESSSHPGLRPSGVDVTAVTHTHGAPDPRFNSEEFSPQDATFANKQNVNIYVATPNRNILLYNPKETRQQRVVGPTLSGLQRSKGVSGRKN